MYAFHCYGSLTGSRSHRKILDYLSSAFSVRLNMVTILSLTWVFNNYFIQSKSTFPLLQNHIYDLDYIPSLLAGSIIACLVFVHIKIAVKYFYKVTFKKPEG